MTCAIYMYSNLKSCICLLYEQEEIVSLEAKLTELKKERDKLKQDIETEEMTIAAVKEELSVEQLQLDKERQQIELRDSELSKEEVS